MAKRKVKAKPVDTSIQYSVSPSGEEFPIPKPDEFDAEFRRVKRLSDKAKRERIFTVIQQMDPVVAVFLEQNRLAGDDPYQTAYALFQLLRYHSRGLLLSLIREAIAQHVCQLKFLLSHLNPPESPADPVSPQNPALLTLDYQSRSLEEYDVSE